MKTDIFQRLLKLFENRPDQEFITGQLRKLPGDFEREIGRKMSRGNETLYDLAAEVMEPKEYTRNKALAPASSLESYLTGEDRRQQHTAGIVVHGRKKRVWGHA